jgi:dihydroxyacetone kinase
MHQGTQVAVDAVRAMLAAIEEAEDELSLLDAACGDGDHGSGMVRGLRSAVRVPAGEQSAGGYLTAAGAAFADAAGGSSGALVGGLLQTVGASLGESCAPVAVAKAMAEGLDTVRALGRSDVGDKTLIDTLYPFVEQLRSGAERGLRLAQAWAAAVPAAERGAAGTRDLPARRGRAAKVAGAGVGIPDAGATSMYYMLRAIAPVLV